MELLDTVELMKSSDYKDRFRAEYYQTKIRAEKLQLTIEKYRNNELNFTPVCSLELLAKQYKAMVDYLFILEHRARVEDIKL